MKVVNQYIVLDGFNLPQMLFELEKGWYMSTNGAFGQRDMSLMPVPEETAKKLIDQTEKAWA